MLMFQGYMSDPVDLPGLAHFCEHMLFLGTEKVRNIHPITSFCRNIVFLIFLIKVIYYSN